MAAQDGVVPAVDDAVEIGIAQQSGFDEHLIRVDADHAARRCAVDDGQPHQSAARRDERAGDAGAVPRPVVPPAHHIPRHRGERRGGAVDEQRPVAEIQLPAGDRKGGDRVGRAGCGLGNGQQRVVINRDFILRKGGDRCGGEGGSPAERHGAATADEPDG